MLKKLFFFLFAILPFSFALNPTLTIDLPIVRVLIPLLLLFWLSNSLLRKNLKIDHRPRFWLLIIFLFLCAISFFWSINPESGIRKLLFLLSITPVYLVSYSFLNSQRKTLTFLKIISWSSFIASIFALFIFSLQFIFDIDTALIFCSTITTPFFLGNSFSEIVTANPSWMVNISGKTIMRTFGSFPDPHLFALYINISLPITAYLHSKKSTCKNIDNIFKYIKQNKYLVIFIITLLASLLSFSRAAYLSLIGSFAFFIIFNVNFNLFEKIKKYPIILTFLILLISGVIFTPNPLVNRLFSSFDLSEGSNSGRIEMWQKGLEIILEKPLTGVGIGGFAKYIDSSAETRSSIYAHNLFLDFGAETSALNMIILIFLILTPIISFLFLYKKNVLAKIIAISFVIFFIHSLFETPFYSIRVFPLILSLLAIKISNSK